MTRLTLLVVLLSACLASAAPAESLPDGWHSHKFNGPNQPTVENGIVTFQIFDRVCSDVDYGDGRGETDCLNGNIRSTINHRGADARLGETVEYRFDLRIDPSLALPPFRNPQAIDLLPGASDSRLRIASWEGPYLHNFIYLMKADARNGVTFLGHQCQPPAAFGEWVGISMTIRWASDERGWIKLMCDDRLVYADENIATNQAPHCYAANVCQPGTFKNPESFHFLLGPVVGGYGHDYANHGFDSPFIDIQDGGITLQMRNMAIAPGGELYGQADRAQVAQLQAALNTLGCDVGAVDGLVGNRTRTQVLQCRYFGDGVAPEKLTLASLPAFLDLYTAHGAADLPHKAPAAAPSRIGSVTAYSEVIANGDMLLNVQAHVNETPDGPMLLDFILIGRFDADGEPGRVEVLFSDDLGQPIPEGVTRCLGVRTETWGDGSTHAVMSFAVIEGILTPTGAHCLSDALPGPAASKVGALVVLLPEIARSIAARQSIDHDGIRAFIARVAGGEIAVAMGENPA